MRVKQNIHINLWKQAKPIFYSVFTALEKGITYAVKVNLVLVWQKRDSEHDGLQVHRSLLNVFKTLPLKLEFLSFKICVKSYLYVLKTCS